MKKVPVFSSIIDVLHLKELIANNYKLEGVVCNLIHSKMHDVYRVTSFGLSFVFKIYAYGEFSLKKIFLINEIFHRLGRSRKALTQKILNAKNGAPVITINFPEGDRFGVMYSYIDGPDIDYKNNLHAELYGVSMAELHCLGIQDFKFELCKPKFNFSAIPNNISSENIHKLVDINDYIVRHSPVLERLNISIIHGDCHGGNAIICSEKVCFIDFDDARVDYSAIDLMAYKLVCLTHLGIDRFHKMMKGYLEINPEFFIDEEQEFILLWERELDFLFRYIKRSGKLGIALVNNNWIESRINFLKCQIGGI